MSGYGSSVVLPARLNLARTLGQRPLRFTLVGLYVYPGHADEAFVRLLVEPTKVKRHVCGKEVSANGNPHLQRAISWACGKHYTPKKKLFPKAHLEKAIMTKDFSYELKGEVVVNANHDRQRARIRICPVRIRF
ncbi:hypothetical protein T492DRAFT_885177 [Pavlovales sp. CCMP2436]|nr:hypothetical protein T492DRAFT_885177 [Pavlovales sp. CCMP2436]